MEIKITGLFRETHRNFNVYCQERWGLPNPAFGVRRGWSGTGSEAFSSVSEDSIC